MLFFLFDVLTICSFVSYISSDEMLRYIYPLKWFINQSIFSPWFAEPPTISLNTQNKTESLSMN